MTSGCKAVSHTDLWPVADVEMPAGVAVEGGFLLGTALCPVWARWCRSRYAWRAKLFPHWAQMNQGTVTSSGWPWWYSRNCLNSSSSCPARTLLLLLIPVGFAGFVAGFVAGLWRLPDVPAWSELWQCRVWDAPEGDPCSSGPPAPWIVAPPWPGTRRFQTFPWV